MVRKCTLVFDRLDVILMIKPCANEKNRNANDQETRLGPKKGVVVDVAGKVLVTTVVSCVVVTTVVSGIVVETSEGVVVVVVATVVVLATVEVELDSVVMGVSKSSNTCQSKGRALSTPSNFWWTCQII